MASYSVYVVDPGALPRKFLSTFYNFFPSPTIQTRSIIQWMIIGWLKLFDFFFTLFSMNFFCFVSLLFSGCGNVFRHSTVVASLPVYRFRHPIPHYAHYQRLPLFGHDLFVLKDRSHWKRAEYHWRIWPLPLMARITVRIAVGPQQQYLTH